MFSTLADLKPVYLIYGSEDLLLEQALERLVRRFSDVADSDYNIHVFSGTSAAVDEIVMQCNTMPFMSERRLVVVRDVDRMTSDAAQAIVEYAKDPAPFTCLVLVAQKVAKNTRLYKAVDSLGGVAEYKAPAKREYPRLVVEMFAQRGKKIGSEAAEVLVRAVGHELRRLASEIDKVCAFTGDEATLSRHDIEEVMSTTAETSVFEFIDELGARRCRGAFQRLAELLSQGESIFGVHALSIRHIRQLIGARAVIERGHAGAGAVASALRIQEWQARNILRQAEGFSSTELTRALVAAAESEAHMKTSREPRLVFERWIALVCGSDL